MNLAYYKRLQRKEFIKNIIFIIFILLFATISTYYIYNKFVDTRDEILRSESLSVSFHDENGNRFSITKFNPVSDNVGLSSKAYKFTIKNNTNTNVKYVIKIAEDTDYFIKDGCGLENKIPLNFIKTGIHKKNEISTIYNLDDLNNNELVIDTIEPKEEIEYTIRFWISADSLMMDNNLHYHGLIQVEEY